ncbi:MAG: hypothetical protein WBQ68_14370 [Terriglobales bacterium]
MSSTTRLRAAPPKTCALLGVLTLAAQAWAQSVPKPDAMTVEIRFTETDPRAN